MKEQAKIPNQDSAILGINQSTGQYIYSLNKILENLQQQHNLPPDEAVNLVKVRGYIESDKWIILNDNFKYGRDPFESFK